MTLGAAAVVAMGDDLGSIGDIAAVVVEEQLGLVVAEGVGAVAELVDLPEILTAAGVFFELHLLAGHGIAAAQGILRGMQGMNGH